jgi:septum formation protein
MTMWNFSDTFLEDYLATEAEKVKASVGCYQMEGKGITLFETIEGNYHTILGMPLLPLLKILRHQGITAS